MLVMTELKGTLSSKYNTSKSEFQNQHNLRSNLYSSYLSQAIKVLQSCASIKVSLFPGKEGDEEVSFCQSEEAQDKATSRKLNASLKYRKNSKGGHCQSYYPPDGKAEGYEVEEVSRFQSSCPLRFTGSGNSSTVEFFQCTRLMSAASLEEELTKNYLDLDACSSPLFLVIKIC